MSERKFEVEGIVIEASVLLVTLLFLLVSLSERLPLVPVMRGFFVPEMSGISVFFIASASVAAAYMLAEHISPEAPVGPTAKRLFRLCELIPFVVGLVLLVELFGIVSQGTIYYEMAVWGNAMFVSVFMIYGLYLFLRRRRKSPRHKPA